jgi:hypothetical protein
VNLSTVQEIELASDALTPEQREELCVWLDQRYSQPMDARLKTEVEAGRFDERIGRAVADYRAGRTESL